MANTYKETMNLPKTDFAMRANLPESEPKRLAMRYMKGFPWGIWRDTHIKIEGKAVYGKIPVEESV